VDSFHHLRQDGVVARFLAALLVDGLPLRRYEEDASQLPGVTLDPGRPEAPANRPPDMAEGAARHCFRQPSAQASGLIGPHLRIDPQLEWDPFSVPNSLGVARLTGADHDQPDSTLLDVGKRVAQLGDLLAAEQSAEMPDEDEQGRHFGPRMAERDRASVIVQQLYASQPLCEAIHARTPFLQLPVPSLPHFAR